MNTFIFVIILFIAMFICQHVAEKRKKENKYASSLYYDVLTLILCVNQNWTVLSSDVFPYWGKCFLIGCTGFVIILVGYSFVKTLDINLASITTVERCETIEEILEREG